MSKLYASIRRSVASDPAPWLLGASAVLAAIVWQLPVPAFLFADEGSGSGGGGDNCACSADDCASWALVEGGAECTKTAQGGPWESCNADLNYMVDCVTPPTTPDKKMPRSKFVYESELGNWCTNVAEHAASVDDRVEWIREVAVSKTGTSGSKKIEFTPKLTVDFSGFDNGNVCVGSAGQIDIRSGFFAAFLVCPPDPDPEPGRLYVDETKLSSGWSYGTHTFKHSAGPPAEWKFTIGTDPYSDSFNISRTCDCTDTDDDPVEYITFSTSVELNGGVKFGANQGDAYIVYSADPTTTTCTAQNP